MNLFATFEDRVAQALYRLQASGHLPEGLDFSRAVVEPPRDASHGDLATNAAMVLAKDAKTSPRALAELIAADLRDDPRIASADIAGPDFTGTGQETRQGQHLVRPRRATFGADRAA